MRKLGNNKVSNMAVENDAVIAVIFLARCVLRRLSLLR